MLILQVIAAAAVPVPLIVAVVAAVVVVAVVVVAVVVVLVEVVLIALMLHFLRPSVAKVCPNFT